MLDETNHERLQQLRAYMHRVLLGPSALEPYLPHQPRRLVDGGAILLAGEPPVPAFRTALLIGRETPEGLFAKAAAFFGPPDDAANPSGFSVELEVESAPEVDTALRDRGWTVAVEEPALVLTPVPKHVPAPPPELDVRRATDEASLADARSVSRTGASRIPSLAAATAPGVALFVGYVAREPVATSRVVIYGADGLSPGKVADVTGVNTLPDHRRKGYGTALAWAAVAEAARHRCAAVVLTATELGLPIYLKMGFIPVSTYRTYEPPPAI